MNALKRLPTVFDVTLTSWRLSKSDGGDVPFSFALKLLLMFVSSFGADVIDFLMDGLVRTVYAWQVDIEHCWIAIFPARPPVRPFLTSQSIFFPRNEQSKPLDCIHILQSPIAMSSYLRYTDTALILLSYPSNSTTKNPKKKKQWHTHTNRASFSFLLSSMMEVPPVVVQS